MSWLPQMNANVLAFPLASLYAFHIDIASEYGISSWTHIVSIIYIADVSLGYCLGRGSGESEWLLERTKY